MTNDWFSHVVVADVLAKVPNTPHKVTYLSPNRKDIALRSDSMRVQTSKIKITSSIGGTIGYFFHNDRELCLRGFKLLEMLLAPRWSLGLALLLYSFVEDMFTQERGSKKGYLLFFLYFSSCSIY